MFVKTKKVNRRMEKTRMWQKQVELLILCFIFFDSRPVSHSYITWLRSLITAVRDGCVWSWMGEFVQCLMVKLLHFLFSPSRWADYQQKGPLLSGVTSSLLDKQAESAEREQLAGSPQVFISDSCVSKQDHAGLEQNLSKTNFLPLNPPRHSVN